MAKKKKKAKSGKVQGVEVQPSQDGGPTLLMSTRPPQQQQRGSGDGHADDTEENPSPFSAHEGESCLPEQRDSGDQLTDDAGEDPSSIISYQEERCLPEQQEIPAIAKGCIVVASDNVNATTREELSFGAAFSESTHVHPDQAKSRQKKSRPRKTPGLLSQSVPGSSGERHPTKGGDATNNRIRRETLSLGQQYPVRDAKIGHRDAHPFSAPYSNHQSVSHMAGNAAYPPPYVYPQYRYVETLPWAQGTLEELATPFPRIKALPESFTTDRHTTLQDGQSSFYHQGLRNAASAPTLVPATRSNFLPDTHILKRHQQLNTNVPPQRVAAPATPLDGPSMTLSPVSVSAGEQPYISEGELRSPQSEKLAFAVTVQSTYPLLHHYWPERSTRTDEGEVWVNKAVKSKRFTKRDGSQSVELTCQNGPSSRNANPRFQCQWLSVPPMHYRFLGATDVSRHMKRHRMDLDDFEVCTLWLSARGRCSI